MTTQEILARANNAASLCDKFSPAHFELRALCDALIEKIQQEAATSKGVGSAAAAIRRMLKAAAEGGRPVLGYAWKDANGKQITCDGYRAYRLNDPLPLPEKPDDMDAPKIAELIENARCRENVLLDAPDVKKVKAFIQVEKAAQTSKRKQSPLWDFGPGLPVVNAQYLLDLLTVLPGAKLYAEKGHSLLSPIYADCERGDAVLLPVRSEKKQEEAALRKTTQEVGVNPGREARENTVSLDDFARLADRLSA